MPNIPKPVIYGFGLIFLSILCVVAVQYLYGGLRLQPKGDRATTAAQAPVPQARLSPVPRSNTRSRMCSGDTISTKPTFTRRGKRA